MNQGESFSYAGATDIGSKRSANEDEIILYPEIPFFAVVDGMGGLPGGAQAARTVAALLPERVRNSIAAKGDSRLTLDAAKQLLCETVQSVSDEIYSELNAGLYIRFGASLVCIWLVEGHAVFSGLGDCRGYILRKDGKKLHQVTEDHNAAWALVQNGTLTKELARTHPAANRLDRFAGMKAPAKADCFIEKIHSLDCILLCSDGLHCQLLEQQIAEIISAQDVTDNESAADVCHRLIEAANEAGGRDNISAVCIKILMTGDA